MKRTHPSILRHIVNLWTLWDYPTAKKPWSLERQIVDIKESGFDGFTYLATPELARLAQKHGLMIVGYFSSSKSSEFRQRIRQNVDNGAAHINVQLADHDTPVAEAIKLTVKLMAESAKLGAKCSVEVHRDTCTETPEKVYALAEGYQRVTAKPLHFTWDFSHIAVVKHLAPPFWERLLVRPDLIQIASQFHLRPFNGQHCQVPVTDGRGRVSQELEAWLPFAKKCFQTWLAGNQAGREIFVVPEMGPASSGYNLHQLPDSWSDAVKLRGILDKLWKSLPGVAK